MKKYRSEKGSYSVLVAITIPIVVGISLVAMDITKFNMATSRVQNYADLAALSAMRRYADTYIREDGQPNTYARNHEDKNQNPAAATPESAQRDIQHTGQFTLSVNNSNVLLKIIEVGRYPIFSRNLTAKQRRSNFQKLNYLQPGINAVHVTVSADPKLFMLKLFTGNIVRESMAVYCPEGGVKLEGYCYCGDGNEQGDRGEQCDDGNNNGIDTCSSQAPPSYQHACPNTIPCEWCTFTCSSVNQPLVGPCCGDGSRNGAAEQCDGSPGCSSDCCNPGYHWDGSQCVLNRCDADGIQAGAGEECDPDYANCDDSCHCPPGYKPDGALGCRPACPDSVLDFPGEQCDSSLGCDSSCKCAAPYIWNGLSNSESACILSACNNNRIQDGDEAGVDCGGALCPPCDSCGNLGVGYQVRGVPTGNAPHINEEALWGNIAHDGENAVIPTQIHLPISNLKIRLENPRAGMQIRYRLRGLLVGHQPLMNEENLWGPWAYDGAPASMSAVVHPSPITSIQIQLVNAGSTRVKYRLRNTDIGRNTPGGRSEELLWGPWAYDGASTTPSVYGVDPFNSIQVMLECPPCGNSLPDSGEQCDDNNIINGDGCSSTCQWETRILACPERPDEINTSWWNTGIYTQTYSDSGWPPVIGIANHRAIDDPADPCDFKCTTGTWNGSTCQGPNLCGNGTRDQNEQCDDSNTLNGDGCSSACLCDGGFTYDSALDRCVRSTTVGECCTYEAKTFPGNHRWDGYLLYCNANLVSECLGCDTVSSPGCDVCTQVRLRNEFQNHANSSCGGSDQVASIDFRTLCFECKSCGNGSPNSGEQCDDGNFVSGDGCSSTCQCDGPYVWNGTACVIPASCSGAAVSGQPLQIRWTATAGASRYEWVSGNGSQSGPSSTYTTSYLAYGEKNATVSMTRNGTTTSATCSFTLNNPCGNGTIDANEQCEGSIGCNLSCQCAPPYSWNGVIGPLSGCIDNQCNFNGILDNGETGIDCGGGGCPECPSENNCTTETVRYRGGIRGARDITWNSWVQNGAIVDLTNTLELQLQNLPGVTIRYRGGLRGAGQGQAASDGLIRWEPWASDGATADLTNVIQIQIQNALPGTRIRYRGGIRGTGQGLGSSDALIRWNNWVYDGAIADFTNVLQIALECAAPVCGNNRTEVREQCDDGNITDDNNGCSTNCRLTPRNQPCPDKPGGDATVWSGGFTISQTCTDWNTTTSTCTTWNPAIPASTVYGPDNPTALCKYECNAGYTWNGTACVLRPVSRPDEFTSWVQPVDTYGSWSRETTEEVRFLGTACLLEGPSDTCAATNGDTLREFECKRDDCSTYDGRIWPSYAPGTCTTDPRPCTDVYCEENVPYSEVTYKYATVRCDTYGPDDYPSSWEWQTVTKRGDCLTLRDETCGSDEKNPYTCNSWDSTDCLDYKDCTDRQVYTITYRTRSVTCRNHGDDECDGNYLSDYACPATAETPACRDVNVNRGVRSVTCHA